MGRRIKGIFGEISLFPDEVREIRRLTGTLSHRQTAEKFGVTKQTVADIRAGRTWNESQLDRIQGFIDRGLYEVEDPEADALL